MKKDEEKKMDKRASESVWERRGEEERGSEEKSEMGI